MRVYKSLERGSATDPPQQSPSVATQPRPITIIRVDKREEELEAKRLTIEEQKRAIKKLEENEKRLSNRLSTLEQLLDECNQEMVRERIRVANAAHKQRY